MELTLNSKHELVGSGYFLGVDGENISEQLIINIEHEELLSKWAYIEFQVNESDVFNTQRLDIVDSKIVYDIPNGLMKEGAVKVQVIFRDDTNFLWKSFVKKFPVSGSINACQNLPEEHPDFITEAQKLLDEISVDAAKIDKVIETEASRVVAEEERVANENARIANEVARADAEDTRIEDENNRIANEVTRQSNETARVNAESQREAKFNTWEGTLGVLDNLSNALKGTASGKVIRVDDVSPVEHNVKVKITGEGIDPSSVTVTRCGKNLLPYPYHETTKIYQGITFTDNNDGTITINGTSPNNFTYFSMHPNYDNYRKPIKKGDYKISFLNTQINGIKLVMIVGDEAGTGLVTFNCSDVVDISIEEDCYYWIFIEIQANTTFNNLTVYPKIEKGTMAGSYEPYKGITYTPNTDGSLTITSTAPTMTLLTDKSGVNMEIEYNQDINVVIKKILDKI